MSKHEKNMAELNDAAFQMKWQARSLEKEANKAQAKKESEMKRAKVYMDKGDMGSAQLIAGEAVRYGKEATNLYRFAGKMSAVGSKLESAARTTAVSMQIQNAVPSLKNVMKTMEKSGVGKNMADFEKVFEDLDVQIEGVTGSLDAVTGDTESNGEVMALLQQM